MAVYNIRPVSDADIDALVPLKSSVQALHVASRPDVFKPMKSADVATWLREQLAEESTKAWIAEDKVRPVGYLMAIQHHREETACGVARQWYEINEVAVEPSFRRAGVGRALLERAVKHARESGIHAVELSTWSFNVSAQAVFERMGFEPMVTRYEFSVSSTA